MFWTTPNAISGTFIVPQSSYTRVPINYVTAEQHVRCISQLSYVFVAELIFHEAREFKGATIEEFIQLMRGCKLYFRKLNLKFVKNVAHSQPFSLSVTLGPTRKVRKLLVCELNVSGVISGSVELVAPLSS